MELYLKVRLAVSEGMTQRQAAKYFNISRDSVAKMVAYSTPPGYQRRSPIRRPKLVVPFRIRLDRLHDVLQESFGWTNSHLYEFRIRDIGFGLPDDGFGGPIDARKETLLAAIEDIGAKSFKYLYDFGDGWTHTVKIEKIFPATAGFDDPFLLEVVGRCPPEDVGGPWGYQEFRQAIADTNCVFRKNGTLVSLNRGQQFH